MRPALRVSLHWVRSAVAIMVHFINNTLLDTAIFSSLLQCWGGKPQCGMFVAPAVSWGSHGVPELAA